MSPQTVWKAHKLIQLCTKNRPVWGEIMYFFAAKKYRKSAVGRVAANTGTLSRTSGYTVSCDRTRKRTRRRTASPTTSRGQTRRCPSRTASHASRRSTWRRGSVWGRPSRRTSGCRYTSSTGDVLDLRVFKLQNSAIPLKWLCSPFKISLVIHHCMLTNLLVILLICCGIFNIHSWKSKMSPIFRWPLIGQEIEYKLFQGAVSRSPCALLKLDFLTNACIFCIQ